MRFAPLYESVEMISCYRSTNSLEENKFAKIYKRSNETIRINTLIESWSSEPNIENFIKICCFLYNPPTHDRYSKMYFHFYFYTKKNDIFSECYVQWKIEIFGGKYTRA